MPYEPLPNEPSGPKPLRGGLDRVLRRLGGSSAASTEALSGHWADLVGESVATHCSPVAVNNSVLVVAVSDPAWASQLKFLEPDLVARMNEKLGEKSIESIEFRVRPSRK